MTENPPTDAASTEHFEAYLGDHLAGSAAALDLIEKIRAENEGTSLAEFLENLGKEIEADKVTLEAVMERLGVPTSSIKQVAGKVMEKLSRMRLNDRVTGGPAVTELMELEMLSLGIEGKVSLWRSLQQVAATRPELAGFGLETLVDRGLEQRAAVERHRLESAARAFSGPPA